MEAGLVSFRGSKDSIRVMYVIFWISICGSEAMPLSLEQWILVSWAKEPAVIQKRSVSLKLNSLRSSFSAPRSCGPGVGQSCVSSRQPNLVPCEHLLRVACFGDMKASSREAEAWHHVTGLEPLKRGQESPLVKVQPHFK